MIKKPVTYSQKDESIMDADFQVIAHAFRKIGMLTADYHALGQEIADAINEKCVPQSPVEEPI